MELVVLGIIAAFVPAVLWLALFYSRDRYEREPKRLIGKLFGAGVVSVIPAVIISLLVSTVLSGGIDPVTMGLLGLVVIAPIVEEPTKAAFGRWFSRNESDFDEPVDGMIYFTTVGLGFGAIETALYVGNAYFAVVSAPGVIPDPGAASGAAVGLAIVRGLTSTMAHGLWSGLVGYFFARRRFDPAASSPWIGLGVAIVAHGLWNAFAPGNFGIGLGVLVMTAILYYILLERAVDVSPHRPAVAAQGIPVTIAPTPAPQVAAPALAAAPAVDAAQIVATAPMGTANPIPAATSAARQTSLAAETRRPCPSCGQSIAAAAQVCRFCRTRFDGASGRPANG